MTEPESFTATLLRHVAARPRHVALVTRPTGLAADRPRPDVPAPGPTPLAGGARRPEAGQELTYGQLGSLVRAVAARLVAAGQAGRPVLVAAGDGVAGAAAVVGCLVAGAVAVPIGVAGGSRAARDRAVAIAAETGATMALTESAVASEVSRTLAPGAGGGLACVAVDALASDGAVRWPASPVDEDRLALVLYTAGTGAAPRGVMLSHAGLRSAVAAVGAAFGGAGGGRGTRVAGWLPLHHGTGLVAQVLYPLWAGATAVLLAGPDRPDEVGEVNGGENGGANGDGRADRPRRWLAALDRCGVTVAVAPDSVWARCASGEAGDAGGTGHAGELRRLDLSRLRLAVSVGERASAVTMTEFGRRFGPAGLRRGTLRAGYGPAEVAALIAVGGPAEAAFAVDTACRPLPAGAVRAGVECGKPVGAEVRVVDGESGRPVAEGRVGEVWVRGAGAGRGYWRRPAESAEAFGRTVAGNGTGFVRTGDLGALVAGRLYLAGRSREVVVFDGLAWHPQEVERRLLCHGAGFGSAVVFAVGDGPERVVVVQEARIEGGDPAALAGRVREVVRAEFGGILGAVLLVRPGTLRRAAGGKVRRAVVRERFLRGELRPLHADVAPGPDGTDPAGAGGAVPTPAVGVAAAARRP